MKHFLATVWVLALVAAQASAGTQATDPEPVMKVAATSAGDVAWSPPAGEKADLLVATYLIYGKTGEEEVLLDETGPMIFNATVAAGHESYGVAVKIGTQVSVIVYSCVRLDGSQNPPDVIIDC